MITVDELMTLLADQPANAVVAVMARSSTSKEIIIAALERVFVKPGTELLQPNIAQILVLRGE